MQRLFLKGLGITLLLNLLVKPATIFMVDIKIQNELGSYQYGSFQTVLNFTFLFSMFLDMGITNFMTRMIAQHPHMIHKYGNRLFTLRILLIFVYVIWTAALYFIIRLPHEWWWILMALVLHQINIITVNYVRAYTGGLLRFGLDAMLSVAERSIYFVLGLLLLYSTFVGPISLTWYVGIFVGSSFLGFVLSGIVYVSLISLPKLHWDIKVFLSILRQSYPFAILVILMMLTMRLDIVLLESIHPNGTRQVAYYTQSFRLLDACWMFATLFGSILLPVFSKVLKKKISTTGIMTTALNILVAGGLLMVTFTIGLRETIFNLLYKDANDFSYNSWVFLSLTFIPMCFTVVFGTLLTANRSLRRLNQFALLSLIVTVVLNLILIPLLGAIGTAITALVAQMTLGILQYLEVRFRMKHRLAHGTWTKLGFLTLALGMILMIQIVFQFNPLLYILTLGAVWMVLIFGLKIIDVQVILKLLSKEGPKPSTGGVSDDN